VSVMIQVGVCWERTCSKMILYQVSVVLIPPLIGFSIKCITYRSETGLLVIQTLCTIEDSDCALLFLLFIAVVSCLYNNKHSGCDVVENL
jgi:hypothetical protein